MRILYGAVGEGLGHATRSRVVAEHLLERGHEVKMVASGRALPYLKEHLPDVEEIWGTSFVLEHGTVNAWKTLSANVRGGARGAPSDWKRGSAIAKSFRPELVITDFDGFAYLYAKSHRKPVLSVDNIQMVDRCKHDSEILRGVRRDFETARTFVHTKIPRANHYVITTFFRPPPRKTRTTLVPSLLRPEIVAAKSERGDHLLVYGRISESSIAALEASGAVCHVYGARDGLEKEAVEGALRYRPFGNEAFIDDLRTARGIVGSAGFSLMSEAVYLRKPMLALPLAHQFEQEMNARYLERMGFGTSAQTLGEPALERFLAREPEHERALAAYEQAGNADALATIEGLVSELARGRARRRG